MRRKAKGLSAFPGCICRHFPHTRSFRKRVMRLCAITELRKKDGSPSFSRPFALLRR